MKLTDKQTEKVANLIKIKLPKSDIKKYTVQLNTVLDAVPVLQELDTDDVSPTSQTHGLQNVLRSDEVEPGLDIAKYPNRNNLTGNTFVVGKVVKHD